MPAHSEGTHPSTEARGALGPVEGHEGCPYNDRWLLYDLETTTRETA